MAYHLIITDHADELIDRLVGYLLNKLKNPTAALHLCDGIGAVYDRLENHPQQFPESSDERKETVTLVQIKFLATESINQQQLQAIQ